MTLKEEILSRKEKAFKEDKIEVFYFLTDILTELPHMANDNDLKDIVFLIQRGYIEEAKNLLNKAISNENKSTKKIKFIKKLLEEKENYMLKSDQEREQIEEYKRLGRINYKTRKLNNALDKYKSGLDATGENVFNYYIGKIYFKMDDFNHAEEYLIKYKENNGADKYLKSILYRTSIKLKKHNYKKYNKLLKEFNEIASIYYGITTNMFKPYIFKNGEEIYDRKPMSLLKTIKMTEEDFVKKD